MKHRERKYVSQLEAASTFVKLTPRLLPLSKTMIARSNFPYRLDPPHIVLCKLSVNLSPDPQLVHVLQLARQ
jgi:hypothetical protein